MIPESKPCVLETVTSICDGWGSQVPAKILEAHTQVKIILFGNFVKGTSEFSCFPRLRWSLASMQVFRCQETAGFFF